MRRPARTLGYLLLAGLAALALYGSWQQPVASAAPGAARTPDYFAFVPSMAGTRPDGNLGQSSADQLSITPELLYLFDYYLAGLGEQSLEALRAEIRRELERRLARAAAREAQRLLDAYLDYKRALVDTEGMLPAAKDALQGARQRLQAMQQTRRQYFSDAEIAALFGASDAYDEDAIARMALSADKTLSEAERQQRWQALDAALRPDQRSEREAPARVLTMEQAVAQARAEGAGDNEVYRLRASAFSPAAAARLAELDREQASWQQRIASYLAQRQQLLQRLQHAEHGADQQQLALQQLRAAAFSAEEQLRLGAYEQ